MATGGGADDCGQWRHVKWEEMLHHRQPALIMPGACVTSSLINAESNSKQLFNKMRLKRGVLKSRNGSLLKPLEVEGWKAWGGSHGKERQKATTSKEREHGRTFKESTEQDDREGLMQEHKRFPSFLQLSGYLFLEP